MKNFKKMMALVVACVMVIGMMSTMAWAAASVGRAYTYSGDGATTNGKITLSNATKDVTYTLYKIFDATYDAADNTKVSYTVPAGALKEALDADYFTIGATPDAAGNYSVTRTMQAEPNQNKPVKTDAELIAYLQTLVANYTEIAAIKSDVNGAIEWSNIPFGYYYILPDAPESKAAVTIDTVNPTATVIDKNQTVSFEKNIIEDDTKKKVNEAGLKEDVTFQIETDATNYVGTEKVFKYEIVDSLDLGMTYKAAPTVKVDGKAVDPASISYKKSDGTATTDLAEAASFDIIINWTNNGTKKGTHLYPANATILVEYQAFLDPEKKDQIVIGGTTDGNTNTAQVKYFKGPEDDTPDESTPSGVLTEQKTDTFTTELTIFKQDQDAKALQGAEFTLTGPTGMVVITKNQEFVLDASGEYWKLTNGTYTKQDPNGTIDGNPIDKTKYASLTDKYKVEESYAVKGAGQTSTDVKVEVGTDGTAKFTGLGAGDYKLVESKVPAGYNKVADIEFTISFTTSDDQNSQTGKKVAFASSNPKIVLDAKNNVFSATIINNKGVQLPSTGGVGTTIFYIIGGILILGAAIALIGKKKFAR